MVRIGVTSESVACRVFGIAAAVLLFQSCFENQQINPNAKSAAKTVDTSVSTPPITPPSTFISTNANPNVIEIEAKVAGYFRNCEESMGCVGDTSDTDAAQMLAAAKSANKVGFVVNYRYAFEHYIRYHANGVEDFYSLITRLNSNPSIIKQTYLRVKVPLYYYPSATAATGAGTKNTVIEIRLDRVFTLNAEGKIDQNSLDTYKNIAIAMPQSHTIMLVNQLTAVDGHAAVFQMNSYVCVVPGTRQTSDEGDGDSGSDAYAEGFCMNPFSGSIVSTISGNLAPRPLTSAKIVLQGGSTWPAARNLYTVDPLGPIFSERCFIYANVLMGFFNCSPSDTKVQQDASTYGSTVKNEKLITLVSLVDSDDVDDAIDSSAQSATGEFGPVPEFDGDKRPGFFNQKTKPGMLTAFFEKSSSGAGSSFQGKSLCVYTKAKSTTCGAGLGTCFDNGLPSCMRKVEMKSIYTNSTTGEQKTLKTDSEGEFGTPTQTPPTNASPAGYALAPKLTTVMARRLFSEGFRFNSGVFQPPEAIQDSGRIRFFPCEAIYGYNSNCGSL